jgi:protocatechuate 3,4-dioxygenase beta subunit
MCDGCDIMFEGMPDARKITSETTLASEKEPGDKLDIQGTVFHKDNVTPATDVILYIYHTDAKGYYSPSKDQTNGRRNGHLRGWIKTDAKGKFTFHSIRPAPYPNARIPAHIHIIVKESGKTRYYIDEVWFDDDPLITEQMKKQTENRGGDMIIQLKKNQHNTWIGKLHIILGQNIPNYK